jgi:predicted membrane channel-forming protein YqfA (hemolysin III family)
MGSMSDGSASPQDHLKTLLEELRVMLPGVEILFAFLLTVPFSSRAEDITTTQEYVYYIAFFASAAAVVLLIAPSIHHRIQHEDKDIDQLIQTATRLSIAGMLCGTVAITAVIYLVSDVLFGEGLAMAGAAIIAVMVAWFWFVMPLIRRAQQDRS